MININYVFYVRKVFPLVYKSIESVSYREIKILDFGGIGAKLTARVPFGHNRMSLSREKFGCGTLLSKVTVRVPYGHNHVSLSRERYTSG